MRASLFGLALTLTLGAVGCGAEVDIAPQLESAALTDASDKCSDTQQQFLQLFNDVFRGLHHGIKASDSANQEYDRLLARLVIECGTEEAAAFVEWVKDLYNGRSDGD